MDQNVRLTPGKRLNKCNWINAIFSTMCKRHFHSLKSLLVYKQHHINTYLGPFQRKAYSKEILNFWRKSWVNPFGKMPIFSTMSKWHFYSLKSLLFWKQHHKNTYLGLFQRKANLREIFNFWPKSWANPFWKIFRLGQNAFFILADCRSRVSHVERSVRMVGSELNLMHRK